VINEHRGEDRGRANRDVFRPGNAEITPWLNL
jgi:hypothetical protein